MDNNNNIVMQFHGMEQREQPPHLKDYLDSLLYHAPSKSTCHLHIFKESRGYLCKLTVHSNIKTFSAYSKDETIKASLKSVLRSVKKQIAHWKKSRSSMELTGVTSITRLDLNILDTLSDEDEDEDEETNHCKKAA